MANLAAQVVMGGPMAAGTVGVVAAAGTALYAFRKKIPHPTEFGFIGCCFLRGGCHEHIPMTICIEVHRAKNLPHGGDVYAFVEAGRFDTSSGWAKVTKKGTADLFERLNLHVRQKDPAVTVSLWQKGLVTSTNLGQVQINVKRQIIEEDWPQEVWYTLEKDGRATSQVQLSFHLLDENASGASPLLQFAMIRQTRKTGAAITPEEFNAMPPEEQLRFLAPVLEGPLKVEIPFHGKVLYFAAQERAPNKWCWCAWKNKEAFERATTPVRVIPLLCIAKVVSDKHSRVQFMVNWRTHDMDETLVLTRIERDRDVWSDGLYEFVSRLRALLAFQDERRRGGWKKKGEGFGLRRRKQRRSDAVDRNAPSALKAMVETIQEGYQTEGEEESDDDYDDYDEYDDFDPKGGDEFMMTKQQQQPHTPSAGDEEDILVNSQGGDPRNSQRGADSDLDEKPL